ncbi:MAG: alpha/beta hydrolase [Erysipelotrichaceae bacterium]|nr:alpha/beta hydrolase [Erysipelotrichaceae bacterium]
MEVRRYTYEEMPEFNQEVEGAGYIQTTGDEVSVHYYRDVEYAEVSGTKLHLQILIPASRNDGFMPFAPKQSFSRPCFVFVQGSGWGKQYVCAQLTGVAKLAARGYVCAIVEYRDSSIAYFPAQACDALNAVRYLRSNHEKYGIDPDRMILAGDSSGGHTAVWGGMLHNDDSAQNLFPGVSGEVCGIVNYYGSTSVMAPDSNPQTVNHCLPDSPEGRVMGGRNLLENDMELAKKLSCETNIDETTKIAPMLIFHGTKDRTVNCTGSVILYNRLKETGHEVSLYLLKGADHGGPEFWREDVIDLVEAFMKKCFASR